jgi:serine/threonine protein kinase KIN1/2
MTAAANPHASHGSSGGSAARRRTTIGASTGQWALGKTIGQGSMGKVKIAKNLETQEQVSIFARDFASFQNSAPVRFGVH